MFRTITKGLSVGSAVAIGAVVLLAGPADAKLEGPCEGHGTFESQQKTYDASTTETITVPQKDTVAYVGSITAPTSGPRSHSGHIDLKLPAPLPSLRIVSWGTKSTVKTADEGVHDYELPSIVPKGIILNLTGAHVDTAGTCTGSVEIKIEGGPFDSPAPTAVSIAGTVITGAGLAFAARPKGAR
jgi:hypothetical protein